MVRDKRRPDNPCKGIPLPKSQDTEEKTTFLTQEEWRLVKAELTRTSLRTCTNFIYLDEQVLRVRGQVLHWILEFYSNICSIVNR